MKTLRRLVYSSKTGTMRSFGASGRAQNVQIYGENVKKNRNIGKNDILISVNIPF